MRWTTNTTKIRERSRRASPQPDYSYLSVDAGSHLDTKMISAPSARLSQLRISTRECTHTAAAAAGHRGGLGCLVEKYTT